jgi:hypothetical protein
MNTLASSLRQIRVTLLPPNTRWIWIALYHTQIYCQVLLIFYI